MNHTAYLQLTAEQLEALRLALGHWIEDNENCLLDEMKDSPRKARLEQLNYHVMLCGLLDQICDQEQHIHRMNSMELPPVPPLPPIDE
jgi:hypothetical protein